MRGEEVDIFSLARIENTVARGLWALGIGKRRRQTLTPEDALSEHLAKRATA